MGYDRQTFINGQVLTADMMNHIETGISDLDTAVQAAEANLSGVADDVDALQDDVAALAGAVSVSVEDTTIIITQLA